MKPLRTQDIERIIEEGWHKNLSVLQVLSEIEEKAGMPPRACGELFRQLVFNRNRCYVRE